MFAAWFVAGLMTPAYTLGTDMALDIGATDTASQVSSDAEPDGYLSV